MNLQSTSTQQKLSKGPADMPNRGGGKPNLQSTSETVKLGRNEIPVAAFGAKPSMGEVQSNSERVDLSRTPSGPYARHGMSATQPEVPFGGGKKRK